MPFCTGGFTELLILPRRLCGVWVIFCNGVPGRNSWFPSLVFRVTPKCTGPVCKAPTPTFGGGSMCWWGWEQAPHR